MDCDHCGNLVEPRDVERGACMHCGASLQHMIRAAEKAEILRRLATGGIDARLEGDDVTVRAARPGAGAYHAPPQAPPAPRPAALPVRPVPLRLPSAQDLPGLLLLVVTAVTLAILLSPSRDKPRPDLASAEMSPPPRQMTRDEILAPLRIGADGERASNPIETTLGEKGEWATIQQPARLAPNVDIWLAYEAAVLKRHAGEPDAPLVKSKADVAALPIKEKVRRLRSELAKRSPSIIVTDLDGTITIQAENEDVAVAVEHKSTVSLGEGPLRTVSTSICAAPFLMRTLDMPNLTTQDFAKAGVRGISCVSLPCNAVIDTRPTGDGMGVYWGERCFE